MTDTSGDEFTVPYPCWFLAKSESFISTGEQTAKMANTPVLAAMQGENGELAIAIFTDSDLADRYCEESDIADDVEIASAETSEILASLLESVQDSGFVSVVFDPIKSTGRSSRVWPIGYAIGQIRKGFDLR